MDFNLALKSGVDNIEKVAKAYGNKGTIGEKELKNYLKNNIGLHF